MVPYQEAERGLPQGLSTSVLLAELNMSCLLHKLHACVQCRTIVYVDDVNVITSSLENLHKSLAIVCDFVHTFCLSLAKLKSSLWGCDRAALESVSVPSEIPVAAQIKALGVTWQVQRSAKITYDVEMEALEKIKQRLMRVRHMPSHPSLKAMVTSSTCLSILDHLAPPERALITPLRAFVRRAVGALFGAPEIVYCLPSASHGIELC